MKEKEKRNMKKLLALLVILCLAASFAAFGEETKVFDAGRVSVSASESWNVIYPDDSTVLLIKGLVPLLSPCVSITYYPMGSLFLDAKELYQDVVDLDPVTTGDYVWTGYDCSSMGMAYTNAVANLPSGSLYVSITRKDDLSISNEEVQAILASIQVVPSATADWFTLSEDGVLTVTLPQLEGFAWQTSGSANSPLDDERSDPQVEIIEEKEEDGVYTLSATGTVTIDGTAYNLTAGTDTFTATDAINYGKTLVGMTDPAANSHSGSTLAQSRNFTNFGLYFSLCRKAFYKATQIDNSLPRFNGNIFTKPIRQKFQMLTHNRNNFLIRRIFRITRIAHKDD